MKTKIVLLFLFSSNIFSQGFEPPIPNKNNDSLIYSSSFYEKEEVLTAVILVDGKCRLLRSNNKC